MTVRRIAVALAAVACAAACRADRPPSAGKEPRVLLRQNFPPGKYKLVQKNEMTQQLTVGAAPAQTITAKQEMTAEISVDRPDAKGQKKIEMSYTSIKMTAPGVSYDSTDPKQQTGQIAAALKPLLKAKLVMVVDKDGKPVRTEGLSALWRAMAKEQPRMKRFFDNMDKQMGDGMMKQMLSSPSNLLSDKPVGVGGVWHAKYTQDVPMIGKAAVEGECELAELKKTPAGQVAVIKFATALQAGGGADLNMGGTSVKIDDVKLKLKGQMQLEVASGLIRYQETNQQGEVKMSAVSAAGQATTVVARITGTLTTTIDPAE